MSGRDAYSEGFRARRNDEPLDANPYPALTSERSAWSRGWRDQDEHLSDRDDALASIGWFG